MRESEILRKCIDLSDIAMEVAYKEESWKDLCEEISKAIPGARTNFAIHNATNLQPIAADADSSMPDLVTSYIEHYGHLNPWNAFWPRARIGTPYKTTELWPSALFERTEFYNDWLLKTGTPECIGMKLVTSDREFITISSLLPREDIRENEMRGTLFFRHLSPRLIRAVEIQRLAAKHRNKSISAAAIVSRDPDAALVIDRHTTILEANEQATDLLRREGVGRLRSGKFQFVDPAQSRWLEASMRELALGLPISERVTVVKVREESYVVTCSVVPDIDRRQQHSPLFRNFLLLLLIKRLGLSNGQLNEQLVARTFGLSKTELSICSAIASGLTVSEVADQRQIAADTVRFHLKSLFRKTNVRRQAEFTALMQQFCHLG